MRVMKVAERSAAEVGGAVELSFVAGDHAHGEARHFTVDADLVPLNAAFAPFPMVKAFVSALLADTPDAVLVDTLSGAALDLARLARALGFPVAVRLPSAARIRPDDGLAMRWLAHGLAAMSSLLPPVAPEDEALLRACLPHLPPCTADVVVQVAETAAPGKAEFGYEAYAFGRRDHRLLYDMQQGFRAHFDGCGKVLDVGCGTGIFLEVMARHGIQAVGVERNEVSARYARSLGHEVHEQDAIEFLATQTEAWDGIYCSHFIEHLPVEVAERLVRRVADALRPGGVALFVFPDPESIRSQLLGFWRDPEHVRFYHPELVATIAELHGLTVEYDNQTASGRRVVPFSMEPPLSAVKDNDRSRRGWWSRSLRRLGIAPLADLQRAEARGDALELAVRRLWDVNQTWAWDDNAVLRFRKHNGI